jgi:hypothetical protein
MLIIRVNIALAGSAKVDWNRHCPCSVFNIIFPAHDILSGYFPTGFLIKILCVFLVFSNVDTYPTYRNIFEFTIVQSGRDFMMTRIIAEYCPPPNNIS